MLPLHDLAAWRELGIGRRGVQLLEEVARADVPERSPPLDHKSHTVWDWLWILFCYADTTIGTCSYAAVPHLSNSCSRARLEVRPHIIELVAHIEAHRRGPLAPPMPAELAQSYEDGIQQARVCLGECVQHRWEPPVARMLAKSLLMLNGEESVSDFLRELERMGPECPACNEEIFIQENGPFVRLWRHGRQASKEDSAEPSAPPDRPRDSP